MLSEIKCPKSAIFANTGCVQSGEVILQVIIAVFSGAVEKFFGQRWLSPLEKLGPYACACRSRVRLPAVYSCDSTWMGDRLWMDKTSWYVTSQLRQLDLPSLRGR